jgi:hypothetical protein
LLSQVRFAARQIGVMGARRRASKRQRGAILAFGPPPGLF